ncbi:hypothetical protein D9M71_402860 [compost metagenome]
MQFAVTVIAIVAGGDAGHAGQGVAAFLHDRGLRVVTADAQQRLGSIEGDADVLRLQTQRLAEQLQRLAKLPSLVTAHPLAIEGDRFGNGVEHAGVIRQLAHFFHDLGVIAITFHTAPQHADGGGFLPHRLQLRGNGQGRIDREELVHLVQALDSLFGQLGGRFRVAGLQQAGSFHHPGAHLQALVLGVFLGHFAERAVYLDPGARIQAKACVLAHQRLHQAQVVLGILVA